MNYDNDFDSDSKDTPKGKKSISWILIVFAVLFIVYKCFSFNSAVLLGISFIVVSILEVGIDIENKVDSK